MSGKGERGGTEGQDVTRRNATGRRLNPFEEQRGRVSENRSRLFRPTLPPPILPRDSSPRFVALGEGGPRRPPFPSADTHAPPASFGNNRLFRPATVGLTVYGTVGVKV